MSKAASFDKWDRVLEKLWKQSRFTSYFYQSVSLVRNDNVPTLALGAIKGRFTLFFNHDFVLDIDIDYLIGLLVHEMLHIILNHEHRTRPGQDVALQNLAQDMVINSYLKEHEKTFFSRKRLSVPPALLLPLGLPEIPAAYAKKPGRSTIYDLTWEEVYAWLKARIGDQDQKDQSKSQETEQLPGIDDWQENGQDQSLSSSLTGLKFTDGKGKTLATGIHLFGSSYSNQQANAGITRILRFIQKNGESVGERLYSDISGLIKEPRPVKNLKWKAMIKSMADQKIQTSRWDFSFARPNKRFFDAGIYAPGRYLQTKPLITVVVDVSGSMTANPGSIEAAFGAVEELVQDYRINLLCIDQDLFIPKKQGRAFLATGEGGHYFYEKGDWQHIKTGSKGATFFAPLFNDYMKNHTEMLIIMTDGQIYDLDALQPYFPTLWIVSGTQSQLFSPEFGEVVDINEGT